MSRTGGLIVACVVMGCGGKAAPPPAAPAPAPAEPAPAPVAVEREEAAAPSPPPEVLPEEPAAPPPDPVTHSFESERPKVELLSKGKGKREPLRYSSKVGEPIDCLTTLDLELRGQVTVVIPKVTMAWRGTIAGADRGQITLGATIDTVEVADAAGLDAISQRAADEMRVNMAPMRGARLEMTMNDRGVMTRSTVITQGPVDPTVVAGMKMGSGGGLVVPDQPLGVGARWRVTRVDKQALVTTTAVATYELTSRAGGVAMITGTVDVVARSPLSDPSSGTGTMASRFTGAHCIDTTASISVQMPPPVSATMTTVITTAQRPAD